MSSFSSSSDQHNLHGVDTTHAQPDFHITMAGQTHIGLVRTGNEDSLFFSEDERVLIVCDGMGGHVGGHIASEIAVTSSAKTLRTLNAAEWIQESIVIERMQHAVFQANDDILSHAIADPELYDMGTTICALGFMGTQLIMGHVGDSRIYRISKGFIEQVSEDHSLVAERVRAGDLDPLSDEAHMLSSILTRALGMEQVTVDIIAEELIDGDIYLVCSDGLTDMVTDDDIQDIVNRNTNLNMMCMECIDLANHNGGIDNITVAIARVESRPHTSAQV